MRDALKRSRNLRRQRARSNDAVFSTAWAASSMSRTMYPVIPFSINSLAEPRLYAMTGVPHAMASIMTSPNGSGQLIGVSRATAPPISTFFSSCAASPKNSTWDCRASAR